MQKMMDNATRGSSMTYLQGSPLVEKDLERALAESCVAVFIMCDKFSANPDEEDTKTILQQFSIRRHIMSRSAGMKTLFCIQLVRPENRRHLATSVSSVPVGGDIGNFGGSSGNQQDIVACINEIKMGVIAKAVLAPGISAMIMNLLASFSDDFDDDEEENDQDNNAAEVDHLEEEDNTNWVDEYKRGCDWEIYTTELSEIFVGWRFSTLSEYLYQKLGIVLLGLQVEDISSGKAYSRTLLNPGDMKIPSSNDMKVEAIVLAKNKSQSDLTFSDGSMADAKPVAALTAVNNLTLLKNQLNPGTMLKVGTDGQGADGRNEAGNDQNLKSTAYDADTEQSGTRKIFGWQKLIRKYGDFQSNAYTHQEAIQKAEDLHLKNNFYVRSEPVDVQDCTIQTSVTEEVPTLEKTANHIIIMGKSLSSLYDLIRPLRSRHLGSLRYIVILYAGDIPHAVWQRISIFEGILVVRGSSVEEADIRRAGIFYAEKVYWCSPGFLV
jgi:hypothetical protein